ncbi:flagellin [Motiliproteus sp. MSK22-1]|uniref:flagellin N-terminal helical domain-containing protein n=1 Tax=Motiliproteus sp. MSK22-1 TaxID=1897630 RepID=UPI000975527F|nr:flagellin [Motiliproteus sp. MSK22-1]OMH30012.1 hypothetical protein BGP75_18965 [Motiliproteus sp. MSK22-1]
MALVINSNIQSLNAQRNLTISGGQQDQAMERLTSGKRINSAGDDAAGLAIANRMTSQVRGLDQAVRNANDGISLIQTAEGALQESTNILQRMRELSIQSANGIFNDENRATLNAEFGQLIEELDRIAETTTFNGQNILNGDLKNVDLQVGAQANETIGFGIQAMDAKTLGMGSTSVDLLGAASNITATSFAASVGADIKDGDVLINGQSIGTFDTGGSGEANSLNDLVESINTNVSGVTASTISQLEGTAVGTGIIDGDAGEGFNVVLTELNGATTTFQIRNTNTASMDEVVAAIGDASNGAVSATINDNGRLVLSSDSGASVSLVESGMTSSTTLGITTAASAGPQLVLTADNDDPITIERGGTGTLLDLQNLGFKESEAGGVIEGAGLSATGAATAWGVGDVIINGTVISNTDTDSLQGKVDAINASTDETGVTANAFATVRVDMSGMSIGTAFATTAATEMLLNGITLDFTGVTSLSEFVDVFNNSTDSTGVTASVLGNNVILDSEQGSMTFGAATANSVFSTADAGLEGAAFVEFVANSAGGALASNAITTSEATFTVEAGLKLTSDNGNPIGIQLGDSAVLDDIGLLEANATAEGSFGTALSSASIDTAAKAQKAIGIIDNALDTVNNERSELGAVNNRLDFTINNLSAISQNTAAARSRIEDADFAQESAELSRAQVLQQAGTAMLAQANAQPQQVLSLLQ